jgi:hypothetical protein
MVAGVLPFSAQLVRTALVLAFSHSLQRWCFPRRPLFTKTGITWTQTEQALSFIAKGMIPPCESLVIPRIAAYPFSN